MSLFVVLKSAPTEQAGAHHGSRARTLRYQRRARSSDTAQRRGEWRASAPGCEPQPRDGHGVPGTVTPRALRALLVLLV